MLGELLRNSAPDLSFFHSNSIASVIRQGRGSGDGVLIAPDLLERFYKEQAVDIEERTRFRGAVGFEYKSGERIRESAQSGLPRTQVCRTSKE